MIPPAPTHKTCKKCGGEPKPVSEFHTDRKAKDQLSSTCKLCVKKHHAEWYAADPARKKAVNAKWAAANRARRTENMRRYRAEKRLSTIHKGDQNDG